MVNVTVLNLSQFYALSAEDIVDMINNYLTQDVQNVVQVIQLSTGLDERTDVLDGSLDGLRNLINVLRLNNSLQVVFQDLGEVVCRLLVRMIPLIPLISFLTYSEARNHGST